MVCCYSWCRYIYVYALLATGHLFDLDLVLLREQISRQSYGEWSGGPGYLNRIS